MAGSKNQLLTQLISLKERILHEHGFSELACEVVNTSDIFAVLRKRKIGLILNLERRNPNPQVFVFEFDQSTKLQKFGEKSLLGLWIEDIFDQPGWKSLEVKSGSGKSSDPNQTVLSRLMLLVEQDPGIAIFKGKRRVRLNVFF